MMTLILNGVCLIAGFLLIGREFGRKDCVCVFAPAVSVMGM